MKLPKSIYSETINATAVIASTNHMTYSTEKNNNSTLILHIIMAISFINRQSEFKQKYKWPLHLLSNTIRYNKTAVDIVTGHARGCAHEQACPKLECI